MVDRVVRGCGLGLGGWTSWCNADHLVGRVPVAGMSDEHYQQVMDVNSGTTLR
ncbi:hypothetical protein [Allorhizocola rhizosphaerae]|uniref:hypothetical protein n=1 Tax=Allorhizocola rhizosphaerae TaxID=1872709 RepID=UPI0013C34DA9|nr:hypothetical protein [Allorhizocola rhizosphaerae]